MFDLFLANVWNPNQQLSNFTTYHTELREFRPVKFEFAFAFGGSKYSQKNKNKILFSDSFKENKRKVLRSKLISQFEHLRSRNGTT